MPTDSTIATTPFYEPDTAYWAAQVHEPVTGVSLDAIFPPREIEAPVVRKSPLANHTLHVKHDTLVPRAEPTPPAWMFIAIAVLCVLTYLYVNSRKFNVITLFRSAVSRRSLDRTVRASNLTPLRMMTIGLLLCAVVAIPACHILVPSSGILVWLAVAAALAVAYFTRWGILRLLGRIFDQDQTVSTYITSGYVYHLLLAILLLPLSLLEVYMPWGKAVLQAVVVGAVALCFATRVLRSLNLFLSHSKSHSFYLFYYLCIVELTPVAVIAKLFFIQ